MIVARTVELVKKGFSIIELMIAVGIFVILTSIAFIGYADFNNDMTMTNQAYELLLHVRQAQVYGIAVRGDTTGADGQFDASYGVHARVGSEVVPIFRDTDGDGTRDDSDSSVEPLLEVLTFARGVKVCAVCAITSGSNINAGCDSSYEDLYVTFRRPDPDARIAVNEVPFESGPSYSMARVVVQAPNGRERYVDVTLTGQVSVSALGDPANAVCEAPSV